MKLFAEGVFLAPPIGKFHLIWKVFDCSDRCVAELPRSESCSPLTRRGSFPASSKGRNSVSFRGGEKSFIPCEKIILLCPADRGLFLWQLIRRGMGRNAVKFIKLSYTRQRERWGPLCRGLIIARSGKQLVWMSLPEHISTSILNLRGQFDPVTSEIPFVSSNSSRSFTFQPVRDAKEKYFALGEEKSWIS